MKLARLLDDNLHNALKKLSGQPLPLKAAYNLKGIQKKIEQEFTKYEEVRKEALNRHGKKDEAGNLVLGENNTIVFEDDKRNEFFKDLNELVNMEIDVGVISIESLGDKAELTADDMMALDGLVE